MSQSDRRYEEWHSGFREFCGIYLEEQLRWDDEDWSPDYYANAEEWIFNANEPRLWKMLDEIDALLALPTEPERRKAVKPWLYGIPEEDGAWDRFLNDFRARVERELAGDRSQPLVDPRGPVPAPDTSPQGYDVTRPSAGRFSSQAVADAVYKSIAERYADRIDAFMESAQPGVDRRLPPMRMRFDRQVGVVALRDGGDLQTRLAVLLVRDRGGEAHATDLFPMEEVPEPPRFEALSVLFAGWLHPDWEGEHPEFRPDPVEQVRRFAASEPRQTVETAALELSALRAAGSEEDRKRAVRGLCSFFLPRPEGQLDAFLAEAAGVIDEVLRTR